MTEQRVIEIKSPMQWENMAADAINREIAGGWIVVSMTEVRALSPVNFQSITSSIVVLLTREAPVTRSMLAPQYLSNRPIPELSGEEVLALGLSVRAVSALDRAGIVTLAQLCGRTEADLLRLKGFGRLCLKQTHDALANVGLRLTERWETK